MMAITNAMERAAIGARQLNRQNGRPLARSSAADHGVYLATPSPRRCAAARLPFEPHQFEFWFAYKNGRNAALNTAAHEIRTRNGALTGPTSTACMTSTCAVAHAEKPDAVAARMGARLAELAATLESAIGTAQAQRETFAAGASELAVTTALTLHDVLGAIDRLGSRAGKAGALRLLEARVRYRRARDRRAASSSSPRCGPDCAPIR
jgi:hypothetical protein